MVKVSPVANAQNEWVALLLGSADGQAIDAATLQSLFGTPDLLAAVAPLDCVLLLDDPGALAPSILDLLPTGRVLLAVGAAALAQEGAARRLTVLQEAGYRILVDGEPGPAPAAALRTVARDCAAGMPPPSPLSALFGPHLARNVDSRACFQACENAGFGWFQGDYPLDPPGARSEEGGSRKRLLTLLALLARDADSRELERQLKQDPALSYHLLKLVNSAAFSCGTEITSFGQAITRIGRRQLQRWLQLLLYARTGADGPPSPLLPLAALRGALLEALCKQDGGECAAQDQAFMAGVFSLLDRLFQMPMAAVVADLPLPGEVEAPLLRQEGRLGQRLQLAAAGRPDPALLAAAGVDAADWWQAQLHAHHWAIQVVRNV
ncbi:HDOD domain-containing protein [Herbaspirillum sp. SJZ107]|uniref:HDOD domain-containing protein n=1 Tax=Herbaspirillum sp. SJZ107 TaxID=2572881 RepID=UPI002105AA00|nr:HDOD domain-containing protein [Herbaspirillum sp. SJZ107]